MSKSLSPKTLDFFGETICLGKGQRPLTVQVLRILERELVSGRWREGAQLPNPQDLSTQTGVPLSAIARSFEALSRRGLIYRIKKKGSFVGKKKEIRSTPSEHLGIVISPVMSSGIDRWAKEMDLLVQLCLEKVRHLGWSSEILHFNSFDSLKSPDQILSLFEKKPSTFLSFQSFQGLNSLRLGIPSVFIHNEEFGAYPRLVVDSFRAIEQMTQEALALGHRQMACFGRSGVDHYIATERFSYHQMVMEKAGFQPNVQAFEDSCETPFGSIQSLCRWLEKHSENTALLCLLSGMDAQRLVGAAESIGWEVPKDLSILSYGSAPVYAHEEERMITGSDFRAQELVEAAFKVLDDQIYRRTPYLSRLSISTYFQKGHTLSVPKTKRVSPKNRAARIGSLKVA